MDFKTQSNFPTELWLRLGVLQMYGDRKRHIYPPVNLDFVFGLVEFTKGCICPDPKCVSEYNETPWTASVVHAAWQGSYGEQKNFSMGCFMLNISRGKPKPAKKHVLGFFLRLRHQLVALSLFRTGIDRQKFLYVFRGLKRSHMIVITAWQQTVRGWGPWSYFSGQ